MPVAGTRDESDIVGLRSHLKPSAVLNNTSPRTHRWHDDSLVERPGWSGCSRLLFLRAQNRAGAERILSWYVCVVCARFSLHDRWPPCHRSMIEVVAQGVGSGLLVIRPESAGSPPAIRTKVVTTFSAKASRPVVIMKPRRSARIFSAECVDRWARGTEKGRLCLLRV